MELPKNYSPTDVCAELGLKCCTFRKLGDGPWAGTIYAAVSVNFTSRSWPPSGSREAGPVRSSAAVP